MYIKISGYKYLLHFEDAPESTGAHGGESLCVCKITGDPLRINIYSNVTDDADFIKCAVLCEALHIMTGLGKLEDAPYEEAFLNDLGRCFYAFCVDNPQFYDMMSGAAKDVRSISSVIIGDETLPVRFIEREEMEADLHKMGELYNGIIIEDGRAIEIVLKQDRQKMAASLLHEVLHGIIIVRDLDFDTAKEYKSERSRYIRHEQIVTDIANSLFAFCVDNPKFFGGDILR
jgi:hypothetical protein